MNNYSIHKMSYILITISCISCKTSSSHFKMPILEIFSNLIHVLSVCFWNIDSSMLFIKKQTLVSTSISRSCHYSDQLVAKHMFPYSLSPIHHIICFFSRFVLYYKRFKISYMIKPVLKILYISLFLSLSLCSRRFLRWTYP